MPRSYLKEFKESIVDSIHQGHTVRSLAKEYGIAVNTSTLLPDGLGKIISLIIIVVQFLKKNI